MKRLTAPGLLAGALAAGGHSFELLKSFQPAAAGLNIAAEEIAHQSIHRGVLAQRRLPRPLQQGFVDGEGEIGYSATLHGSRVARESAVLRAQPMGVGGSPPSP